MQSDRQIVPTRTLILTGFADTQEYEDFRKNNLPKDKVFETYTVPNSNFLFVIFFDLRDSMKFKNSFNYSNLKVQYTISKYEIPKKSEECSGSNYQSTVNFLFKDVEITVEDTFIVNFLKQYGEIRELKSTKPQQKTIEFFDFRSAQKAYDTLNDSVFGTGTVKCKYMWDLPLHCRTEYLAQTDELLSQLTKNSYIPDSKTKNNDLDNVKKPKLNDDSNKNVFLKLFDSFIATNMSSIERILKPK